MFGAWATTAATLCAAVAFAWAAQVTWNRGTREMAGFYGTVAVFLIVGAMRQVAALAGSAAADKALFYLLLVPAAVPILFLVAMAGRAITGHPTPVLVAAWTAAVCIGLWHAYWLGLDGPFASTWGTEWRIRSGVTRAILIGFVTLPGIGIGAFTWWRSRPLAGADGRRLRWVGASIAIYYVAFTIDALAPRGPSLVLTRLVTALVALAVVRAYLDGARSPSQGEEQPARMPPGPHEGAAASDSEAEGEPTLGPRGV